MSPGDSAPPPYRLGWATGLAVGPFAWSRAFGVAAAAVHPWAWYVVIAAPLLATR